MVGLCNGAENPVVCTSIKGELYSPQKGDTLDVFELLDYLYRNRTTGEGGGGEVKTVTQSKDMQQTPDTRHQTMDNNKKDHNRQ